MKKLYEMANSWKNVRSQLENHLFVMFEHLVKVYYYHDYEEYILGWVSSIRKGFEHIKKLSNTNQYPTEEQMFQFIWNEWLDGDIDIVHKEIIEDLNKYYDEVPPIENIDYKGFHDFAIGYCKYLSSLVSEKGSIKMEEVFDFIESYF